MGQSVFKNTLPCQDLPLSLSQYLKVLIQTAWKWLPSPKIGKPSSIKLFQPIESSLQILVMVVSHLFIKISSFLHVCPCAHFFTILILFPVLITYSISCLRSVVMWLWKWEVINNFFRKSCAVTPEFASLEYSWVCFCLSWHNQILHNSLSPSSIHS